MLIELPPPSISVATRYGSVKFSCWLRGVEVAIRGYIEPADRLVGIMADSLVIEDLITIGDAPHWKCPDIDDLLDTGEYAGIAEAFWSTYNRGWGGDYEYYIWWGYSDEFIHDPRSLSNAHVKWLNYWLTGKGKWI